MYQKYIKRCFDLILALFLIIISSPILLVVAVLVRTKLGSPVIFRQERPGYKNKVFTLYKFRTMTDAVDENGNLLSDEQRLTKFGQMLRSTSLDELPEFFNILFGHMSFVGPRPLLKKYVSLYNPRQSRRHDVLPGLTGLAQVNGRNAISWEEKFEFDIEYVENISFLLDIKIVIKTFLKVLTRAGISAYESVTMESFQGTRRRRFSKYRNLEEIRILFSGIGNRVEFVESFLYAAGKMDIRIHLVGTDSTKEAPALYKCHKNYQTPQAGEAGYVTRLLAICRKEKIGLLIPSTEKEIFILSQRKDEFAAIGTRILVGDEAFTGFCSNKKWTAAFFEECGIRYPKPVHQMEAYHQGYPCVLEILDENDNITQTRRIEQPKDLTYLAEKYKNISIRPFLEGKIYEIDVFCDFAGNPIYITPRAKEDIEGREISRYRVVRDEHIVEETKKIIDKLKPIGPITMKMLRQETTGTDFYLRIEPRFDDNVPISIKAGADSSMALLKLMTGETLEFQPEAADDNMVFGRFEKSICLNTRTDQIQTLEDFESLKHLDESIEAVVFDLDDTLYSEKEYIRSGYRAVAESLPQVKQCFNKLCVALEKGQDAVETVLKDEKIYTEELRKECYEVISKHQPDIHLYDGVKDLFFELHKQKKSIGIITDGESSIQRTKLKVLGLEAMADEIIITDELAGNGEVREFRRPNDISFIIMKKRFHTTCRNMAFVGDDKELDFKAPEELGMECYWKENKDGLYE